MFSSRGEQSNRRNLTYLFSCLDAVVYTQVSHITKKNWMPCANVVHKDKILDMNESHTFMIKV